MVSTGNNYFYRGNVLREDLADFIQATGYPKHPFMDSIGDSEADSDRHEWNERARRTRDIVAKTQGYDYTAAGLQHATRRANLTQILAFEPFVSATSAASKMSGGDPIMDSIEYETGSLLDAVNYSLVNASLISGGTATAQQMEGALRVLITTPGLGLTTINSGISATTTNISGLQDALDNRGFMATDIFMDSTIKSRISSVQVSNTKFIDASARKLINVNAVIEGDFGISQIQTERDIKTAFSTAYQGMVSNATMTKHLILAIDRREWSKAWLRRPGVVRVPPDSDGVLTEINCELTLRYDAATAGQIDYNVL